MHRMHRSDEDPLMRFDASDTTETLADQQASSRPSASAARPNERGPRTLDSEELFEGERELHIMHGDACYRLTITRLNKLILTK